MSATVTHAETYTFVTKWDSQGIGEGQFYKPGSIAVDSSDNVYVVNKWVVEKLDSNGNYLTGFNYGFYDLGRVAVDSSGNVYVSDPGMGCIDKFDSNGKLIAQWELPSSFSFTPIGVAVDSSGTVYAADSHNNCIQKFDSNGNYLTPLGSPGNGNGQFNGVGCIAVDSSGNLYVADTGNARIQKFDSNGNYLAQWGSPSRIVAVDSSGNVYVADSGCIQKSDSNGNFITRWGSSGNDDGQFNGVGGIAVDSSGNVYVSDLNNNRIQIFAEGIVTPIITWNNPASIINGTALSSTQLNAVASVPGTFVYTPPAGTILSVGNQTLHVDFTPTDAANYTTALKDVTINVLESDELKIFKVVDTYYECNSWSNEQYPLINLFGEDYVPLLEENGQIWESHVDKLAKLVIDSKGSYSLMTGENLDLGQGYSLQVMQVDVDGQKVWLELDKNGQYVADEIISTDSGDHTWTCTLNNIQGVNNVPVLKVHVNQVFQGATDSIVQIDGVWLIDYTNSKTLKIGDRLGDYTLTTIINGTDASNLGTLVFESVLPKLTKVVSNGASGPVWSPNGYEILFARDGLLYKVYSDGSDEKKLWDTTVFHPSFSSDYAWSPDGSKISYLHFRVYLGPYPEGGSEVNIMNADGTDKKTLLDWNLYGGYYYTWFPSGSKIAYVPCGSGSMSNLSVINSDGSNDHEVGGDPSVSGAIAVSPDSSKIAYSSWNSYKGAHEIRVQILNGNFYTLTTGKIVQPTRSWQSEVWSPDSSKIVYTSNENGHDHISTIKVDGTGKTQLTSDSANYTSPTFSPDGSKILYVSDKTGNDDIWVMNSDGSNKVQLTTDTTKDSEPVWSPDGKKIAFYSERGGEKGIYTLTLIETPAADFSASPIFGGAPLRVTFTDKSTGSPTSWSWNFGDRRTSTVQNPVHTYKEAGRYPVSLTVKNKAGNNTKTRYITVFELRK